MSTILIENRCIAVLEIDGAGPLSNELTTQLSDTLDEAEDLGSASIMLVHIVGQADPGVLCPWPGRIDIQAVTKWERFLRRIERSDSTTVVFAERACSATALELLLVADRRLASSNFSVQCGVFGREVWPGMALYRLARQLGESRVRTLIWDAADIPAQRGVDLSIIDEIISDLDYGTDHIARLLRFAALDDLPVRRRLMQDSLSASFDDALGAHLAACDRALRRFARLESQARRTTSAL